MMKARPFDMLEPLTPGRRLIESSAGTGKTYTIASLYVRLLLEKGLQAGQILVVTFTRPATEELKGRIRQKIRDTLAALDGEPSEDEFIQRYVPTIPDPEQARSALSNALRMFDEAAIFTIHGFCGRMLQENAFESASLFDTELVTDESDLRREIADDFYRLRVHGVFSPLFLSYAIEHGFTPDALAAFIRGNVARPFFRIIPDASEIAGKGAPSAELETAFFAARETAIAAWESGRDAVASGMASWDGLNRNRYRTASVAAMIAAMDRYADSPPTSSRFHNYSKFRQSEIVAATKARCEPLRHPFFEAFERLDEAVSALLDGFEQDMIATWLALAGYARDEMAERKCRRNVRSYDDLLRDMFDALKGQGGATMAATVRERFQAALIDEFQDTDPLQYEIFGTIFPERSYLFLIGDPKQAIYGFRGADIFAYLKAAGEVRARFTLDRNFRSVPGLVNAVNTLFGRRPGAFVFPEIEYPRVEAASEGGTRGFALEGTPDLMPFKIRMIARPDPASSVPIPKTEANRLLPESTATEIVALLSRGQRKEATIGGEPVTPRDVAVLVRTNGQARAVHAALRRRGVPAVIYSSESVFASEEAVALERVLLAVADPGHDGKVRAALATPLFQVDGNTLARLQEEPSEWDERVRQFSGWRDLWANDGFITMVRSMTSSAGLRSRLLALPDGDRRLTNLLHLFELLHEASHSRRLGIEGLLKWLPDRMADTGGTPAEEHQLRLETDEAAVKVVTVHKCKGLEYPVVFCPYAWDVFTGEGDGVTFHDPDDKTTLVRDIGSARLDENRRIAERESLAENARLLYVALTRAKHLCVVGWGAIHDAGRSALAMLLHSASNASEPGLADRFSKMTDDDIRADLERLPGLEISLMQPSTDARYISEHPEAGRLACREIGRAIARDWGSASFTSLVSGARSDSEWPDRDLLPPSEIDRVPASARVARKEGATPFDFPKGAKSGLFFHGLMEKLDFAATDIEIENAVKAHLEADGFDPEWTPVVSRMVRNVLDTPLDADVPGFRLSGIASADRRHEVEFGLPLALLTPGSLRRAFSEPGDDPGAPGAASLLDRLAFLPIRGMMKGYIDLVFSRGGRYFLLDWKTNHLGDRIDDYSQPAMREAMDDSFYFLQYHLYAVALHRYLRLRLGVSYDYDRHFGGVYYLFVRGIDPAFGPRFGVCFDRPDVRRVEALGRLFSGERANG
ncbi:MAG TPA: exodeoxyribonuclease V subunit beta [Candidatus Deferrimicrobiaceae bacterium]|jgi:exodeoxyribonuclease V beta subunit